MSRAAVLGLVAAVGIAALMLAPASDPERPRVTTRAPLPSTIVEGLRVAQRLADGSLLEIEIGSARRAEGRVGFLRSPLLRRIELRDVRIRQDGRTVFAYAQLDLGGGERIPDELRPFLGDLKEVAHLAQRYGSPF